MVLPALVLQKPSKTTKSKDHIKCMERRHSLWKQGNFEALPEEGRASQGRLQPNRRARRYQEHVQSWWVKAKQKKQQDWYQMGAALGASSFKETYVQLKVDKWKEELQSLVEIAATQPQAAYTALIVSIKNKWSYLARTTETIGICYNQSKTS